MNRYNVSFTELKDRDNLIVGQSLTPTSPLAAGAHVLRGIYLPELSQLPDISLTIDDWVKGNEDCPLPDFTGAFNGVSRQTACHHFRYFGGALNATHFMPLAGSMYEHYHSLALQRMAECHELTPILQHYYYDVEDWLDAWAAPFQQVEHTEVHECEREAFVYEMMAQHFLQDAWATGHMWHRWGYPHLQQFPADVGEEADWECPPGDDECVAEQKAQRATIALMVGTFAGMIHGAKAVVKEELDPFLFLLTEHSKDTLFFNDPLSGPQYNDRTSLSFKDVEWRTFQSGPHPGVGDLFWAPPPPTASLSRDEKYEPQRRRLLACSAASLREVYQAGPQLHGPPLEEGELRDEVRQAIGNRSHWGPECWTQLATNESMEGAVGPTPYQYGEALVAPPGFFGRGRLMGIVNDIVISERVKLTNVGDEFVERLKRQVHEDTTRVISAYTNNANHSPRGTASARNQDEDGRPIRLLGADPNRSPEVPDGEPPVEYADRIDENALERAERPISRMFWRGHLRERCLEAAADDGAAILALKRRCVASAVHGGDPNACTACVNAAEAHIPQSFMPDHRVLQPSKCQAIQAYEGRPALLPEWWFDWDLRWREVSSPPHGDDERMAPGRDRSINEPSYYTAFHWCTETTLPLSGMRWENFGWGRGVSESHSGVEPPESGDDAFCALDGARGTNRWALFMPGFGRHSGTYFPPLVAAVDESGEFGVTRRFTSDDGPDTCWGVWYSDLEGMMEDAISMPVWHNREEGVRALEHPWHRVMTVKVDRCGLTQRVSLWNRACDVALGQLGVDQPHSQGAFDPETGFQSHQWDTPTGPRCLLREPRRMRSCAQAACDAGGLCVEAVCTDDACMTPAPPASLLLMDTQPLGPG